MSRLVMNALMCLAATAFLLAAAFGIRAGHAAEKPVPASAPTATTQPVTLRVLSYNIHHGEGVDRKLDLDRIAKVIRDSGADLVAPQEVDANTARTGKVHQAKALAEKLGFHFVFGRAIEFQGGDYGNAVLSRWPIVDQAVSPLPNPGKTEARSRLDAQIEVPGLGEIVLASTHFSHDSAESRLEQVKASLNTAEPYKRAKLVLLAGDFNAAPDAAELKPLAEHWHDPSAGVEPPTFTVPVARPTKQIDYVLIGKSFARHWTASARVVDEPVASDHRPLLLTLTAKPADE
jgi:endonuclease/exonuclease/phosphatase family metal-dependent hydrolase